MRLCVRVHSCSNSKICARSALQSATIFLRRATPPMPPPTPWKSADDEEPGDREELWRAMPATRDNKQYVSD